MTLLPPPTFPVRCTARVIPSPAVSIVALPVSSVIVGRSGPFVDSRFFVAALTASFTSLRSKALRETCLAWSSSLSVETIAIPTGRSTPWLKLLSETLPTQFWMRTAVAICRASIPVGLPSSTWYSSLAEVASDPAKGITTSIG